MSEDSTEVLTLDTDHTNAPQVRKPFLEAEALKAATNPKSLEVQAERADAALHATLEGQLAHDEKMFDLQVEKAELEKLAYKDTLTGLYNRRWLMEELERRFTHAKRTKKPVYGVFGDIDHFKWVNSEYGHGQADEVLKLMAQIGTRKDEPLARLGGEEFLQIFENVDEKKIAKIMRRTRMNLDMHSRQLFSSLTPIKDVPANEKVRVAQLSYGVVKWEGETVEEFLQKASETALHAKNAGRNQGFFGYRNDEGKLSFQPMDETPKKSGTIHSITRLIANAFSRKAA